MAIQFLTKIFGSRNDRLLKTYRKSVERINALEPGMAALSLTGLGNLPNRARRQMELGESGKRLKTDPV